MVGDHPDVAAVVGERAQERRAGEVHVLVFVDEQVAVASEHLRPDLGILEQCDRVPDQVAEVDRVQDLQPFLVGRIKLLALAGGERGGLAGRNLVTWTNYSGIDPETNLGGAEVNLMGIDYFNNPSTRTFVLMLGLSR